MTASQFPDTIGRHWRTWWSAWRQRKRMGPVRRLSHELEFLPAVLEVQDTPPSPIGRLCTWTIILFFAAAILWAIYGEVDIVSVAHGKIIPVGHSKVIQPLEIGKVVAIHVSEGQSVKRDDLLLELDPTTQQADYARTKSEWSAAGASLWRIDALFDALRRDAPKADDRWNIPENIEPKVMETQKKLLRHQFTEHRARAKELENQIRIHRAELAAAWETIKKLKAVVPIVTQRAEALKRLHEKRMVSKNAYLELEQARIEQVQDLAALQNRPIEIRASIAQAQARKQSVRAEFRKTLHTERAGLETRLAILEQEVIKAETRTSLRRITAPVDGVVQQLAVHTVGGVVTPAQALMVIVPDQYRLEVEAYIENKDIGFVEAGQPAEIKIDAFPFTRYGVIDGEIVHVARDAIENEKLGWVFSSRIAMNRPDINIEGKTVNLSPGMSVSVEVKTGKRKLIQYVLSPLLQYADEVARER